MTCAFLKDSYDVLQKKLFDLNKKYMNLRFQKAHQQIKDTSLIAKTKKDIARIKTVMHQQKKGAI